MRQGFDSGLVSAVMSSESNDVSECKDGRCQKYTTWLTCGLSDVLESKSELRRASFGTSEPREGIPKWKDP